MVQTLEATAFQPNKHYDCINYYTNGNKYKQCQAGLKWHILTRQHPTTKIRFFIRPKTKRQVPYSQFAIRVGLGGTGNKHQLFAAGDTTNLTHLYCHMETRYNEWHQDFNFKRA